MITWWMKLGGNRPPGDNPLFFSISGTGSYMPSRTDTAGHTEAFDYPVTEHWGESWNAQFRRWDSVLYSCGWRRLFFLCWETAVRCINNVQINKLFVRRHTLTHQSLWCDYSNRGWPAWEEDYIGYAIILKNLTHHHEMSWKLRWLITSKLPLKSKWIKKYRLFFYCRNSAISV